MIDTNDDGKLSKKEIKRGFEKLGMNDEEDLQKIFKMCDFDGDEMIDFDEFLTTVVDQQVLDQAAKINECVAEYNVLQEQRIEKLKTNLKKSMLIKNTDL